MKGEGIDIVALLEEAGAQVLESLLPFDSIRKGHQVLFPEVSAEVGVHHTVQAVAVAVQVGLLNLTRVRAEAAGVAQCHREAKLHHHEAEAGATQLLRVASVKLDVLDIHSI